MTGRKSLPIVSGVPGSSVSGPAAPGGLPGAGPESGKRVFLVTLGCAKNEVDSEVMLGSLRRQGFSPTIQVHEADLILVNTCAFMQSAVEESLDVILELAEQRKTGRGGRLVVAGCLVERYRDRLVEELPEVDQFLSTDELLSAGGPFETSSACLSQERVPSFLYDERAERVRSPGAPSAFVKIAEGCDRLCAFCIIPKLRGPYRSRSIPSVVAEVRSLLASGVCEVNLVAQDLTAFGQDTGRREALVDLLLELGELRSAQGDFWLRLLYAYPTGMSDRLLAVIRDSAVVCPYLDLPLQHISAGVLQRMRRPLGEAGTRSLVEKIRRVLPEAALRTTFLVGFPGETEEDMQRLEDFVGEGHFTHVGVFPYSPEPESEAASHGAQVPESEKKERVDRIMSRQQKIAFSRLDGFIGRRLRVLVEGPHPETDLLLSARAAWQAPETDGLVIINQAEDDVEDTDALRAALQGRFVEADITGRAGYDLVGRVIHENISSARTAE